MGVVSKERRRLEAQQFMARQVEPVVVEVINDLYASRTLQDRADVPAAILGFLRRRLARNGAPAPPARPRAADPLRKAAMREARAGVRGSPRPLSSGVDVKPILCELCKQACAARPARVDAFFVDCLERRPVFFPAHILEKPDFPTWWLPPRQWRCVWRDDFNYDGLPDPKKWTFQTDCNKWVHDDEHSEQQWYTAGRLENARVGDGVLRVTARKEEKGGCAFTSARLAARCHCLYGRVEVCARLPPPKRGLWPALWLLPTDSAYGPWPRSGEIDLCENVGWKARGTINSCVHTEASNHRDKTHQMTTTVVDDAHDAFHVYALTWRPDELLISVDGAVVHSLRREEKDPRRWPFDKRFFLVLNLAVGGRWGGKMGVDDIDEASLEIAYVRVFREQDGD